MSALVAPRPGHRATPFEGIWPALLTPLTANLDIDHARFARHAKRLVDAGCEGVTPFGTTGEGPSFSVAERIAAVDALVEGGVPGPRILVSTSCAALPDVVQLTRHALSIDAHGCLMLPPFFLKGVPDAGVIDAYARLIDSVADARLRIYLYHIPQVCGVALSHDVIRTLKQRYPDTIVGLKDSGGDRTSSLARAAAFMGTVRVYVGHEPDLPVLAQAGSTGAVSGLANMLPRLVHDLVAQADSLHTEARLARVQEILAILTRHALIPALKGTMALIDQDEAWLRVRPPLVALSTEALTQLMADLTPWTFDITRDATAGA